MTEIATDRRTNGQHREPADAAAPGGSVDPRNRLNALTGRQWIQETKSVWFQRGLGKDHDHAQIEREHPAPFSYQDVQRLIEFFTKPGGEVLDPFVGVGSTLKAAALAGRNGIGFEIVPRWAEAALRRLGAEIDPTILAQTVQTVRQGDARALVSDLDPASIDFVVTSPPYWGILNKRADHKVKTHRVKHGLATRYSDDLGDLANIESYEEFLSEVVAVFEGCRAALRPSRYMAIVVGDFRHRSRFIPYHADLIRLLTEVPEAQAFELSGITILAQNSKPLYPYGYPFAYVSNVHHQYVLIFRKPSTPVRSPIGTDDATSVPT